jgi:flagellar motility protein MotE (MotC chaperone)
MTRDSFLGHTLICFVVFFAGTAVCAGAEKTGAETEPPSQPAADGSTILPPEGATKLAIQMMEEVRRKEKALAAKEEQIKLREEKIKELREELIETMRTLDAKKEELESLKKEIKAMEEKLTQEEEEKLLKLARVFESSPPEQGGRHLSEIDPETAARVLVRMNARKAGRLWAFVDTRRAAEISRILIKLKPDFKIEK